jgi:hypothetical protein
VLCAATTGFFFLLNGIFILYAVTKHDFVGGISDLYVGSCSKVSLMDTWLHFAINVASTIILSASNCRHFNFVIVILADRVFEILCK